MRAYRLSKLAIVKVKTQGFYLMFIMHFQSRISGLIHRLKNPFSVMILLKANTSGQAASLSEVFEDQIPAVYLILTSGLFLNFCSQNGKGLDQ
jgi:hypothetical protein